jgi:hypothetical protein
MTKGSRSRLVYVKRTRPHTVHELDCDALETMAVDSSGAHRVGLADYEKVGAADVPVKYPRCRVCGPGVF